MNILKELRRKTVRGPVNPLDKATVFSIYPKEIYEHKPTIQPGYFRIPPGTSDSPSRLLVEPSSWWREIDQEQPLLEIPVSAIIVAESIVKDYNNGLLAATPDRHPGLFYVPGDISVIKMRAEFKTALEGAINKQRAWFRELVRMADILWARTNGNPLAISEDMRMGARELNLLTKDWMSDHQANDMVRCVACGQLRNPNYPICQHCKNIVDPERAKELGLKFAS